MPNSQPQQQQPQQPQHPAAMQATDDTASASPGRRRSIAERATAALEARFPTAAGSLARRISSKTSSSMSLHGAGGAPQQRQGQQGQQQGHGQGTAFSPQHVSGGASSLTTSSMPNIYTAAGWTAANGPLGSTASISEEASFSMGPEDYTLGQVIGQGSSATVYTAVYKPLQKQVSIKVIDLDLFERNQIDELRREIQIMSLSKHVNLLPVYGSFVNGSKLFIVTPFLAGGSCLDIMKTSFKDGFDEHSIAVILKQALQGLDYLHKNGLIHRDVKAGNLLLDKDGLVQLADFGVSSSLMDSGDRRGLRKTFVGTPCWMAPEVMEQSGYDYKADIWSFGITAIELAYGHAPYAKFPPLKVLMLTLQNEPPTLDRDITKNKYSKAFKEMIDSCLKKDPAKRPTAEKLLQHAFFKSVKKNSYLETSICASMVPITQRQHLHKMPALQSNAPAETTHEWDFDDESSEQSVPAVTASLPVEGSDAAPVAAPAPVPRGKDLAVAARPSSVSFADAPVISLSTSEEGAQQPQARKSRFVIDGRSGSTHSQSDATPASTPPDHPATANTSQPGSGSLALPASSALSSVANAQSYASPTASIATIQAGEVKKGRFSILESGATSSTSSAPTPAAPQPPAQQPSDASSITQIPMTQSPSVTSNASSSPGEGQVPTLERKSGRFAIQTTIAGASATANANSNQPGVQLQQQSSQQSLLSQQQQQPARLQHQSSTGSASSGNEPAKLTRKFTVSSESSSPSSPVASGTSALGSLPVPSGAGASSAAAADKRGRFHISSSIDNVSATASFPGDPSESGSTIQRVQRAGLLTSALAPFPTDGAAQDRYDTLLRVAEAQRHVIQEVLPILNRHGLNPFHMSQGDDTHNRANSYSADTQHAVPRTSEASQIDVDLRLTAAMRELQALRVENDALRKSLAGMQSSAAPAAATASSSPLRHANTRS